MRRLPSAPLVAVSTLAALFAGCASPRPAPSEPGPGEGPLVLMEPHWDQVCRDDRSPQLFRAPSDILDDPSELLRVVAALLPDPVPGEPHPWVDVAVTYARSGEVRTVHHADSNVDRPVADRVVARVAEAVRPQERLLIPTFLRVRAVREPAPALRVLPGQFCLAHITHEEGEPPRFLEGARIGGRLPAGMSTAASGASGSSGAHSPSSPAAIGVQLHISRTGELLRVEPTRGDESLLPRVMRALAETTFDPALLNGEPTRSIMPLVIRFPD